MSESVIEMLGRLAPLLTQPTFRSFVTMVTGWARISIVRKVWDVPTRRLRKPAA